MLSRFFGNEVSPLHISLVHSCYLFYFLSNYFDNCNVHFSIQNLYTLEGRENIDTSKTYLYMANHVSLFDVPLLGGFIPGCARGVEADRQHAWPLYGWAMRRLGNIPINRKSVFSSLKSIGKTVDVITEGKSMIILPEGHRTMDGKLRKFKSFPFLLVKKVEVEIIPIGLSGLYQLKSKNSWVINPKTIKIKFGKPISTDIIKELSTKDLRDNVRQEIESLIEYL